MSIIITIISIFLGFVLFIWIMCGLTFILGGISRVLELVMDKFNYKKNE